MPGTSTLISVRLNPITLHHLDTYCRLLQEMDTSNDTRQRPPRPTRSSVIRTAIHRLIADQLETEPLTAKG